MTGSSAHSSGSIADHTQAVQHGMKSDFSQRQEKKKPFCFVVALRRQFYTCLKMLRFVFISVWLNCSWTGFGFTAMRRSDIFPSSQNNWLCLQGLEFCVCNLSQLWLWFGLWCDIIMLTKKIGASWDTHTTTHTLTVGGNLGSPEHLEKTHTSVEKYFLSFPILKIIIQIRACFSQIRICSLHEQRCNP